MLRFRSERDALSLRRDRFVCKKQRRLLVLTSDGDVYVASIVKHNYESNWPTTNLAIFNVILGGVRLIDEDINAFAAIGAIDIVFDELMHLPALQSGAAARRKN